jgi:hypothetical protein
MTYLNKNYSSSTEHIITKSSPDHAFDIELQHPQPRRRQMFDRNTENDINNDQYHTNGYSLSPKQDQFFSSGPNQFSTRNNIVTIPANISTILPPDSIMMSSSPIVVEEK